MAELLYSCNPHSVLPEPCHLPERKSSIVNAGFVQCSQPMLDSLDRVTDYMANCALKHSARHPSKSNESMDKL